MSGYPDAVDVADQLDCYREFCRSPERCWIKGACLLRYPEGRVRDSGAMTRKRLRERECRVPDCGDEATDAHHLLYRSRGGDDVEANIIPLCHDHHMMLHHDASAVREEIRREVGASLTSEEIGYITGKLGLVGGHDFLEREYGWKPERSD